VSGRRLLAAVAITAIVIGGPASAAAEEVSFTELSALAAAAAAGDDAARARLAAVTDVDGTPVSGSALLEGRTTDVERRLRTLAALAEPATAIDADQARADAVSILAGDEYQRGEPTPPGWLQRFSEWLAGLVPDEIGELLANPGFWFLLALIGIGTVVFFLVRNAVRRRRGVTGTGGASYAPVRRTADDLERQARLAADDGDFATAVRLWFEAGAIRLADRGVVAHDTTSTSGAIRRAVPTATMNGLATTFDRVAYGGRHATAEDAAAAEQGWTSVVTELQPHD